MHQKLCKKPILFSKWLVRPWSSRPVLTFEKHPKLKCTWRLPRPLTYCSTKQHCLESFLCVIKPALVQTRVHVVICFYLFYSLFRCLTIPRCHFPLLFNCATSLKTLQMSLMLRWSLIRTEELRWESKLLLFNENLTKPLIVWSPLNKCSFSSLRSRRLEVVGPRKNGRARRRHACLPRAHPFSVSPTTCKHLLRRLQFQSNLH